MVPSVRCELTPTHAAHGHGHGLRGLDSISLKTY
jgi:hypothetical protein